MDTIFAPLQRPQRDEMEPKTYRLCLKVSIVCLIGTCIVLAIATRSMYNEQRKSLYCGTLNIPYDRTIDMHPDYYGNDDQEEIVNPFTSFL